MKTAFQKGGPDDLDARARRKAAALFFGLCAIFWIVSALSRETENARTGLAVPWETPWVLEGTSLLVTALLFFLVWEIEARWPLAPGRVAEKIAAHIAGAIVFSVVHILAMVALREAWWLVAYDVPYQYLRNPVEDVLYDFRKDAVTYVTILMIIHLCRSLETAQAERLAAARDAEDRQTITLKSGGRTLLLPASEIEAVQADGNYVRVFTGRGEHHARLPLAECLALLTAAGRDVRRVHKSWILDFSRLEEARKTAKGDVEYRLRSGRTVRGSRRYRPDL